MPPQVDQSNMTPEDAKASLGIATMLQSKLLPQDASIATESDIEQEQPQEDLTSRIDVLETQFQEFQKATQQMIKDEIGGIKDMIKESLQEDDKEE